MKNKNFIIIYDQGFYNVIWLEENQPIRMKHYYSLSRTSKEVTVKPETHENVEKTFSNYLKGNKYDQRNFVRHDREIKRGEFIYTFINGEPVKVNEIKEIGKRIIVKSDKYKLIINTEELFFYSICDEYLHDRVLFALRYDEKDQNVKPEFCFYVAGSPNSMEKRKELTKCVE